MALSLDIISAGLRVGYRGRLYVALVKGVLKVNMLPWLRVCWGYLIIIKLWFGSQMSEFSLILNIVKERVWACDAKGVVSMLTPTDGSGSETQS